MVLTFTLPLKTVSLTNVREHWGEKARRANRQRHAVSLKCPKWSEGPLVAVLLVRIAPCELDDDNLRGALKHVRDGVASRLGVDDRTPLVRWEYAQEKGEPGVRVTISKA